MIKLSKCFWWVIKKYNTFLYNSSQTSEALKFILFMSFFPLLYVGMKYSPVILFLIAIVGIICISKYFTSWFDEKFVNGPPVPPPCPVCGDRWCINYMTTPCQVCGRKQCKLHPFVDN